MNRILVAPGEFSITADRSAILETYLGSCVGIALYDPEAVVGGLLHIILPEGNKEKETETPSRYATSGIPLLIENMEKLGASRQRMVASLAGGAMMLTDSRLSVNMNIGRRNSVMTAKILKAEGIPVISEDTGGI